MDKKLYGYNWHHFGDHSSDKPLKTGSAKQILFFIQNDRNYQACKNNASLGYFKQMPDGTWKEFGEMDHEIFMEFMVTAERWRIND